MSAETIEILSHCGMRCDLCPAFAPNKDRFDLQRTSAAWEEYFATKIPAETIACDGCRGEGKRLDATCPVRPCVLARNLDNCGDCDEGIPCERLSQRWVDRDEIEARLGKRIPENDFRLYLLPFMNAPRIKIQRKQKKNPR